MIEEVKKAYFELIDSVGVEEVYYHLPNKKSSDFKKIMYYLIYSLVESYKEYMAFGEEDASEILSEIEAKIKICMEHYGYSFSKRVPFVNKIIFNSSDAYNYFIDSDLKKMTIDHHLRKVFEYCLYGVDESDKEKVVHYNSNNKDLAGYKKYKDYQTRLYLKSVENNVISLFGLFSKKDTDDLHLDGTAAKRIKDSVNKELHDLRIDLEDPAKREKIFEENYEHLIYILEKIGFEFKTVEEEFDIQKVEKFLLSELSLDYTLMPKKADDNFDYYVYCALEILEDKGFVDLNDERARKINLGAWLDKQIKDIASYKLSDERKNDIIMLISSKKSRLISNGNESNHYPISNVIGLNSEDIDHSNGVFVHSAISDYYFRSVASSKWIDFYLVARSIFKDKGFVDLEDERAKEINLGKWLDLQIELLSKGMLDETKKEYIELLISNMDSRKEKIIVPELLDHRKKIDLSKRIISKIRNSAAIVSLDDLKKLDESVNEINSKNR